MIPMKNYVDFASNLSRTPNWLENLKKEKPMMKSISGQSSVNLLGYEIPIRTVPDDVLPAGALFIGNVQIVDTVFPGNTKEPNTMSRIITFNAKNAMVLKGG